jgi:hypothetical protein
MSTLMDSFQELVKDCAPDAQNYGAKATIDQNLGLVVETAKDAGLDLRDPATLAALTSATALVTSWTLNHIAAYCGEPDCAASADRHVRVAVGQFGVHLAQLEKLIAT